MGGPVKRNYDTSLRRDNAERTRRHILDTAKPLFVDRGYAATSMRQLAKAAGVSLQTLYNAFSSKFGLFSALMDVIVAGDHEPLPLADRPEARALEDIDEPTALLAAIVDKAIPILSRVSEIYPVLRAAAGSDVEVAESYQRYVLDARREGHRRTALRLHRLGALSASTDADQATDILWAVLSPDVYDLLVGHRGWSKERFETWATDALTATLLSCGPRGSLPR